jgi:FtsZ-binding cell division protein ZapB
MGIFKGNNNKKTDEERLWEMLNISGKGTYSSYSDSRKKEILDIFKESEQKAIDTISIDLQKDIEEQKNEEKKRKEAEDLKEETENLKDKDIDTSLKVKGLDNLSSLTEDLVKRANFPTNMMQLSNFITQLSNVGNPTNMHMLNMSQTNVSQNFVFIKLLDEIKKDNSKIIQQNDEIIELLRIISEK